tara:strand:+ start:931 stop:1539 length:609 start_codon:yes stop_codon:yes gene_type:complete
MKSNEVSLVNIVYQYGSGGQFLSYLISINSISCMDKTKLKPAVTTKDNEYLYTTYHPFLSRTHPHNIEDYEKLTQNKIIVITCDDNVSKYCSDLGFLKHDKTVMSVRKQKQNLAFSTEQKQDVDDFLKTLHSNHKYITVSYDDLFLKQDKAIIKKMFSFCCMEITEEILNKVAENIRVYTETNKRKLVEFGINLSKYNIRSL